jgi:hypothetical protein
VGLDQAGAQFVQEIFAPIRDLGVKRPGSLAMAGALRTGPERFQVAVKAFGLDRRHPLITERRKGLQPQINAHTRDRAIENRADGRFISRIPDSQPARPAFLAGKKDEYRKYNASR